MYLVQKGWLPLLVVGLSYLFPFVVLIKSLAFLFKQEGLAWPVAATFLAGMLFFPVYFGMLAASFFPSVEIEKGGIRIFFFGFFAVSIKWEDIDSIVYYPNGYVILRIDKNGIPLLNGLYFYSLQGKILRSRLPIIILSPWLQKRDEVLGEIINNSTPGIVHQAR